MTNTGSNIIDDYSPQIENYLVNIIEQRSGITFDSAKRHELKQDIMPLLESLEFNSYETYYKYLQEGKHKNSEIKKLINVATINETFFFRVEDHFTILKETLLPQIIEKNNEGKIRIWCAGCSSGEEVYSIAITLLELQSNHLKHFDFKVFGTDINDDMISTAKEGVYSGRTLNLVPKPYLKRYFEKKHNRYIVKDFVKTNTSFEYLNLTESFKSKFKKKLDIIFFRNVFIYFNRATNIKIIDNFHSILKTKGYLFLGPSETLWKLTDKFLLLMFKNAYIYQKPGYDCIEIKEEKPQFINNKSKNKSQFENKEYSQISKNNDAVFLPEIISNIEKIVKPDISTQHKIVPTVEPDHHLTVPSGDNIEKLNDAENFINIADYENAEKIVDNILNIEKTNKEAIILKLLIFSNRSDKVELLVFTEEINNVIPIFPELHYILGNYFESIGEIGQAIISFKKVIFIDRQLIQAREKLLKLYSANDNFSGAKLEARNLLIQIKKKNYKSFSSRFLPKTNINRLEELCMEIQNQ